MTAPEQQRLAALSAYDLLAAPAGDELEAVVRVAAMVAATPDPIDGTTIACAPAGAP